MLPIDNNPPLSDIIITSPVPISSVNGNSNIPLALSDALSIEYSLYKLGSKVYGPLDVKPNMFLANAIILYI